MTARSVVVAVDSSAHSKAAFEFFIANVWRPDDQVVITHIPEVPHLPTFSLKHGIAPPVEEWRKALQGQIDKVRKLEADYEAECIGKKCHFKILASDLEQIHYKTKGEHFKSPGEGIIAVSEAENADLVVMGTRGLDRIRRTLLGSVSDYVVRHSKVPVMVCPHHHS